MKNLKKKLAILFTISCLALTTVGGTTGIVNAATNILPKAFDNLQISLRAKSKLVATADGYMRVYYDGKKVGVEYYDDEFNIKSKKLIAMELDIWGGFYAGTDAYYLIEGQNNTVESDSAEVIRVIKYDTNWNKKGVAKITGNTDLFGGEVRYPFDYGCVEMTERNGILYIVTGHEGYVDPAYNQGHQGFLMIAVDEATMNGEIVDCDLWHSFAQYIECKDSNLYVLEQSEGSRYTKLSKYNADTLDSSSIPVLEYGGVQTSAWAIACYASVDGMALSSDNVLCLGTSIDQSKYDELNSDMAHNIYLTVTPMSNFTEEATTVKWFTNFNDGGKSFLGAKITKINDNRFMLSWEVTDESGTVNDDDTLSGSILHYVFIDGNGNKVSIEYTAAAPVSECQPIVKDSKIVYYASNSNMVNFYTIDAQSGKFSKKKYRTVGDNATWTLNNGVLTISGTGDINIDTEANPRKPVSSTSNYLIYSSSDNSWKPIRDKVTKIIIETGLTSISDNAFAGFNNLIEVDIKPGLISIGTKAFYSCGSLEKITIPSSVTKIGEDFLWTGYYWVGDESHVVEATIYTQKNSYAAKYAEEQDISCIVDNSTNTIVEITVGETTVVETTTATKEPKRVDIIKLTSPKRKTIKIKWKKIKEVTGYQIQVARNARFSKGKKTVYIQNNKTTSKKITKLAKKKKYFVRMRAYKKVNGKKVYGVWSKVKKIRCK